MSNLARFFKNSNIYIKDFSYYSQRMAFDLSRIGGLVLIVVFLFLIGVIYYGLIVLAVYFICKYTYRIIFNVKDIGNERGWWR